MTEPNMPQNKPKRKATRTTWKPGKSGNPGGRPKAIFVFGEYLRNFLNSPHPQAAEINSKMGYQAVKTRLDEVVLRLLKEKPEVLLHYGFGKPVESHEITGANGGPLKEYVLVSPDNL